VRPLRMTMRAFGPYADTVELDFRDLADRSLFLIHGPTGAGKTSILDAMCFALFGEAAGTDRKGKESRSHFADPSVVTEVVLEFALGPAHWRVTRTAEHARPGGVTMRPAQASLERIADDGTAELRASKVRDVDAEVVRLLGFMVDQFRQVVLLPQGEFRRLLVSDSKSRAEILETLFGAELYRRIEAELKKAGAALEREVNDERMRIETLLGGCDAESVEALAGRGAEQESRRVELEALTQVLRAQAGSVEKELAEAEKAAALLKDHAAAAADVERLERDAPSWARRRDELAAARRAQGLEALAERQANASATHEREKSRHAGAVAALSRALAKKEATAAALAVEEARAAEREEAETLRRRLEAASDAAARLARLTAAIAAAETRLADAVGAISLNGRDISYAEGRVDAADKELAPLRPLVAELERRRGAVAEARRILAAADELATTRSFLLRQSVEVGGARQRQSEAETLVARSQAAESDLLRRWSEGQAALLSRELRDGEACPVCGSTEHPKPAASTDEVPSQADVDAARAAIAKARFEVDARRRDVEAEKAKEDALRSKVSQLEGSLGTQAQWTLPDAAAALARAEADLVEAGKAHARIFELEQERGKHVQAIAEATTDRDAARARMVEVEKQLAADRAAAVEIGRAIPGDLAPGGLASRLAEAAKRSSALLASFDAAKDAAAAAAAELGAAEGAVKLTEVDLGKAASIAAEAASAWNDALAQAGFATSDEFGSARRSGAAIDALEAELRRFDEALASARARAERTSSLVAGLAMPDLEGARARAVAARAELETALAEHSRVQEALATTRRTLAALGDSASRIEDAERRYRAVGRVAAVASGSNPAGISFARFVLASLLDDVLDAATERLIRMSQGRFALTRAGERRDRRRGGGLDLEVFDAHTGVARPAATLSGGESFLASLSLALGLADVVQSHTGGIRLETMFIDEGFGTLDPEALDLAMRALEDLQAGGRLVGIISHVPELKERIGARLEVIPGRRGSSARFAT